MRNNLPVTDSKRHITFANRDFVDTSGFGTETPTRSGQRPTLYAQ